MVGINGRRILSKFNILCLFFQLVQNLHDALGKLQLEASEGTYNCRRFEPVLPPTPTTPLSRATTPGRLV